MSSLDILLGVTTLVLTGAFVVQTWAAWQLRGVANQAIALAQETLAVAKTIEGQRDDWRARYFAREGEPYRVPEEKA